MALKLAFESPQTLKPAEIGNIQYCFFAGGQKFFRFADAEISEPG